MKYWIVCGHLEQLFFIWLNYSVTCGNYDCWQHETHQIIPFINRSDTYQAFARAAYIHRVSSLRHLRQMFMTRRVFIAKVKRMLRSLNWPCYRPLSTLSTSMSHAARSLELWSGEPAGRCQDRLPLVSCRSANGDCKCEPRTSGQNASDFLCLPAGVHRWDSSLSEIKPNAWRLHLRSYLLVVIVNMQWSSRRLVTTHRERNIW